MAGLPLAQRLRDKGHEWEDLEKLIPDQNRKALWDMLIPAQT